MRRTRKQRQRQRAANHARRQRNTETEAFYASGEYARIVQEGIERRIQEEAKIRALLDQARQLLDGTKRSTP